MLKVLLMLAQLNPAAEQYGPLPEPSNLRPNTYSARHTRGPLIRALAGVSFRQGLPGNVCNVLQAAVARVEMRADYPACCL